jgi:hypothetical protein
LKSKSKRRSTLIANKMVLYSKVAIENLSDILIGLISWEKHPLGVDHATKYVSDIRKVCDSLDSKAMHFNTQYADHKQYGEKVHNYKRNKQTNWYIIYNLDHFGNVFGQRIISNYVTIADAE